MGLREFAIILITALACYLLLLAWRWWRLDRVAARKKQAAVFREPFVSPPTLAPDGFSADMQNEPTSLGDDDAIVRIASSTKAKVPSEPDASSFSFDALLEMRQTRHIVDSLRSDQEAMQGELFRLREEVTELNARLTNQLSAINYVSPLYEEAVGLARRGLDAQAIAERCGISVSEAELVRALAGAPQSGE